ncbi:MAG: ATP-binding cassette domain-containing protein [Anaerolineales bacterium]|jgi:energy-coupling factor transporter ATP-binding protein EcfA2
MSKTIIEIENYSWQYLHTEKPALEGIHLTVEEGSFVGIIGPNGSGKTTLALSMDGLIPANYQGIKKGTVKVLGKEVEDYTGGELQRIIGMVFSDPESQFTAMTVEDELVFGLENLGLGLAEIRERLDWVTDLTQLKPLLEKPPYEISGGQKQRVALAAVLAMMPRVILLDEPTSMLDPISRKRVFEVLEKLRQERRNTVIVIEHSLENLVPLTDQMILLQNSKLILNESTDKFFQQMPLLLERDVFPPDVLRLFYMLSEQGLVEARLPFDVEEAAVQLTKVLGDQ